MYRLGDASYYVSARRDELRAQVFEWRTKKASLRIHRDWLLVFSWNAQANLSNRD